MAELSLPFVYGIRFGRREECNRGEGCKLNVGGGLLHGNDSRLDWIIPGESPTGGQLQLQPSGILLIAGYVRFLLYSFC